VNLPTANRAHHALPHNEPSKRRPFSPGQPASALNFRQDGPSGQSAIACTVTAGGMPVVGAEIVVAGKTYVTSRRGEVRIDVTPGAIELTIVKDGFAPVTTTITVAGGQQQLVTIELEKLPSVQETVTVSATRTDRGLEDQPMRVEVLDAEEIDEKLMMTPGDVVMMLNEMGGMRVQATSPSLGAASVRIQGMRGRYTRFLSDGLPLFGEQVSLGLMQIPPIDLPRFAYTFTVPGVFVQDDLDVGRWLAISASARLDQHSEFGTFISPRISGLVRHGPWSSRVSYGTGFFAPTPITEETEAAGLSRLSVIGPLKPERGKSASFDVTRTSGPLSTTLTLFDSSISDPVDVERTGSFVLKNLPAPTTNSGVEALAVWKAEDFSFVANYAYVRSRETTDEGRVAVPLTPRHSVGLDVAWEREGAGRLGVEWFYTGTQRLDANPYRTGSRPYSVFGVLATRRVGRALLFINGENLTDVRRTRWEPLLRPARGIDGRWTVDAWAPLDGRNINGGMRLAF
jgi:outer membrane receptor for ferrienterochelin and colicin